MVNNFYGIGMDRYHQLYADLMNLPNLSEAFYYADQTKDSRTYRIFNYRLCSYSDWLHPGALESRGIMFDITNPGDPVLVCMPMEKFFNLNETKFTENLDLTRVAEIWEKLDGSLISTFIHAEDGSLAVKSRGSLNSEQAQDALEFIKADRDLHRILYSLTVAGHTCNLEWCAPHNHIVIPYAEPSLRLLNVRNINLGGVYLPLDQIAGAGIKIADRHTFTCAESFLKDLENQEDTEGVVMVFDDGLRVKVKTPWYVVRHRAKDAVNTPRGLFEACVQGAADDVRGMFPNSPEFIARIDAMSDLVYHTYNAIHKKVHDFYQKNQELSFKDYAILGQKEIPYEFHLAMALRRGREISIEDFMLRNYTDFVNDEENVDE